MKNLNDNYQDTVSLGSSKYWSIQLKIYCSIPTRRRRQTDRKLFAQVFVFQCDIERVKIYFMHVAGDIGYTNIELGEV